VTLCEQKRSVGRKFLIAGKGGLNLTHSEELDTFVEKYRGPDQPEGFWKETVGRFDNKMIRGWAARLDVGTFVQKSGRVYPKSLKAAPLLRRWIKKLRDQEVELRMNHRLVSLSQESAEFETPEGTLTIEADAIILAMGGASWPQTGSDGAWVEFLKAAGISVTSLSSANCGWEVAWPEDLVPLVEAQPLKNIILACAGEDAPGEIMLTRYGMEGGPIYKLGPALREMESPLIKIDLKPTFTAEKLAAKMESVKRNFLAESAQRWKLSEVARLLLEYFHGPFESSRQLAVAAKALTIPLTKARPIAEAISSAGGVTWSVLDSELMLRELPGVFVAGEMIDWEAPTGGYLLQGCFASGTLAAEAALKFIELP
jgi:uncharacterized flavoprotein (TIGR03862 family)